MEKSGDVPAFGFDTNWQMRVPSDLVMRMHVHARSRGLTASSWVRLLIIEALDHADGNIGTREAA